MINDGGSMDLAIMSHLYREPIGENELKAKMMSWNWSDIVATLSRLIRKALVVDINKARTGHVYKLTREGERFLETLISGRSVERPAIASA